MKKEKIYECEVKRQHQIAGQRFWKWIRRSANEIDRSETIRCHACKGKVRLHQQRNSNGPRDHVEHFRREDSVGCKFGVYYDGIQRESIFPLE